MLTVVAGLTAVYCSVDFQSKRKISQFFNGFQVNNRRQIVKRKGPTPEVLFVPSQYPNRPLPGALYVPMHTM